MSLIEIQLLDKVYNPEGIPVRALNGVTLSIESGEFTAIVGPSGSGKTTLLNAIGGLDAPTSGSVHISGTDVFSLSDRQRTHFRLHHLGFVFQSYNLIPVLTARENIEFIMQIQGVPQSDYRKRSLELLDAVGLGDKTDKRPAELSGGQQQRVAVARALASNPDVVLADEPTANLDSASTTNLLDIMTRMNRDLGITFVFSTHDQRVVDRARRVITLVDGAVSEDLHR
jgi:putative ABC transport system ATP-binding protein